MLKYFYGPDTFGAREAIGSANRQITQSENQSIYWVDREHLEEQSFATILDQASSSLFGGQLVVVRDPSSFPKALQEQIVEAVKKDKAPRRSSSSAGQTTPWVVWDRSEPDKRSTLFKALKPHGTAFPLLSLDDAATWLQKEFSNVERPAAMELARRCGSDRWRMKNESEKLALTCKPITRTAVEQEVPPTEAAVEIFPFLDVLASGNARRAMQLLEELLAAGNSELYVLSMLGYQYKTLLAIAAGKADGLHPFVIQKNKPAAKRYSVAGLQNILARLAATDFAIKQGKVDQRTALIMLVLNLSQPVRV